MVESRQLDTIFHALADGTRRAILHNVSQRRRTVTELAQQYPMSLAAVSKHLDVLERSSLIRRERHGRERIVSLNPHPLEAAQDWLAFYQKFWSEGLDRLQTHFEKES